MLKMKTLYYYNYHHGFIVMILNIFIIMIIVIIITIAYYSRVSRILDIRMSDVIFNNIKLPFLTLWVNLWTGELNLIPNQVSNHDDTALYLSFMPLIPLFAELSK